MSVIEQIKAHFESLGDVVIMVPEWGPEGSPLEIHAAPITVGDRDKLYKFSEKAGLEFLVQVLILKAKDAEGKPMFTKADRWDLLNKADSDVVQRVSNAILRVGAPDEEDLGN